MQVSFPQKSHGLVCYCPLRLWGAYVVHPIQAAYRHLTLPAACQAAQARVKQKAAQRLAELVPGVEQGTTCSDRFLS